MHTAVAYDKDGNSTGVKYNAFSYARLVASPVKIVMAFIIKLPIKINI